MLYIGRDIGGLLEKNFILDSLHPSYLWRSEWKSVGNSIYHRGNRFVHGARDPNTLTFVLYFTNVSSAMY